MNRRDLLALSGASPLVAIFPKATPLTIDWGVVWRNIGPKTPFPLTENTYHSPSGIWRVESFDFYGKPYFYPRWLYSPHYRSPFQIEKLA